MPVDDCRGIIRQHFPGNLGALYTSSRITQKPIDILDAHAGNNAFKADASILCPEVFQ